MLIALLRDLRSNLILKTNDLARIATMEEIESWVRGSYLVASQSEFEARLSSCEESMKSLVQSDNSDGVGEILLRLAAFLQWNPSFEMPGTFLGE